MIVKCPTCGKDVIWSENSKYRPFCSERCKLIDLGAWASDSYVIHDKNDQTGENNADEAARKLINSLQEEKPQNKRFS